MHPSVMVFAERALTAELVTGRRILEVGSYDVNGSVRPFVESLEPATYLGVDAGPGPRVDRVVDCTQLTESVGTDWGVVISTEMMEHAQDWRACMTQMADAVAPGGVLLVTTRGPGFPYHAFPDDYWRFTVTTMGQILDALGLQVLLLEDDPQAPGVFALARKSRGWQYRQSLDGITVEAVTR